MRTARQINRGLLSTQESVIPGKALFQSALLLNKCHGADRSDDDSPLSRENIDRVSCIVNCVGDFIAMADDRRVGAKTRKPITGDSESREAVS